MIPELGHFALILALCMALVLGCIPIAGAFRNIPGWIAVAKPAALGQWLFVTLAYGCLTYSSLVHDFSVAYIAHNSNTALPTLYLVSGVGGRMKARYCCGLGCCPVGRAWWRVLAKPFPKPPWHGYWV